MIDYLQPPFYRFNEDSLILVKWVLKQNLHAVNILDLGAGCGIIGIELARDLKPEVLTLVEAQPDYLDFLKRNSNLFLPDGTDAEIVIKQFSQWSPERRYDLIVTNPPYYLPGHGQRNADPRKERARSFVLDNWQILLGQVHNSLTEEGRAYMVVKDDKKIIQEIAKDTLLEKKIHPEKHLLIFELTRLNKN